MKIGDQISIKTGAIINIVEYKDVDLAYYCVKVYESWTKKYDLIWVEAKRLNKLLMPSKDSVSTTHIKEYT